MLTGETITVSLEMENTGSEPWDESTRLATTEPRDRESPFAGPEWPGANRFAQVKGVVMPGETYKFTWEMHAPKTPGLFEEHIGLVQEGKTWFSDSGQGGPPDGQLQGIFQVDQGPVKEGFNPFGTPKRPVKGPDDNKKDDPANPVGCSASAASTPAGTGTVLSAAVLALSVLLRRRRRS